MIGRTHGVHAEPTTFGAKVALWALQVDRDRTRLRAARESVAVMKLSGAVGTYSNIPPAVEAHVGERARPAAGAGDAGDRPRSPRRVPVRVRVDRRRRASSSPSSCATSNAPRCARCRRVSSPARRARRRCRTSATRSRPRRSPGWLACVRSNLLAGLQDVALWHERDISHSSVERVVLPDSSQLAHYVMRRLRRLLDGLQVVMPDRMLRQPRSQPRAGVQPAGAAGARRRAG